MHRLPGLCVLARSVRCGMSRCCRDLVMRILFARQRAGDDAPHESGGESSILTSLWVHA